MKSTTIIRIVVTGDTPIDTNSKMTGILETLVPEIIREFPMAHIESEIKIETPEISIDLNGPEGNAFAILGRIKTLLKSNNLRYLCADYVMEATASDYDNLKAVSEKYAEKAGYKITWVN